MLHLYDTPYHHSHLVTKLTEVLFQIFLLQIICIFGFVAGSVIIHEASGRNQSATGVFFFFPSDTLFWLQINLSYIEECKNCIQEHDIKKKM